MVVRGAIAKVDRRLPDDVGEKCEGGRSLFKMPFLYNLVERCFRATSVRSEGRKPASARVLDGRSTGERLNTVAPSSSRISRPTCAALSIGKLQLTGPSDQLRGRPLQAPDSISRNGPPACRLLHHVPHANDPSQSRGARRASRDWAAPFIKMAIRRANKKDLVLKRRLENM